jgi:hypothetical protein
LDGSQVSAGSSGTDAICGGLVRATTAQPVDTMAVRAWEEHFFVNPLTGQAGVSSSFDDLGDNFKGDLPAAKDGVFVNLPINTIPAYAAQLSFVRSFRLDRPGRFINANLDIASPEHSKFQLPADVYPFDATLHVGVPGQIFDKFVHATMSELVPNMEVKVDTGQTPQSDTCTSDDDDVPGTCQPMRIHFSSGRKIDAIQLALNNNPDLGKEKLGDFISLDLDPPQSVDACIATNNGACVFPPFDDLITGRPATSSFDFDANERFTVKSLCMSSGPSCRAPFTFVSLDTAILTKLNFSGQLDPHAGYVEVTGDEDKPFSLRRFQFKDLIDVRIPEPGAQPSKRVITLPLAREEGSLICPAGTEAHVAFLDLPGQLCSNL